jgi:hypothetical protein
MPDSEGQCVDVGEARFDPFIPCRKTRGTSVLSIPAVAVAVAERTVEALMVTVLVRGPLYTCTSGRNARAGRYINVMTKAHITSGSEFICSSRTDQRETANSKIENAIKFKVECCQLSLMLQSVPSASSSLFSSEVQQEFFTPQEREILFLKCTY